MAELLQTSTASISDFENGKRQPPADLILKTSFETGFLPMFFLQQNLKPFLETECSFRHRRTTAQRAKDQVRAHASLIGMLVEALGELFRFPDVQLISQTAWTDEEIEGAAQLCRASWQLDTKAPIMQVGRALERAGIIIIASSVETSKIDAFSRFGSTPLVFLNRGAGTSASRWNFDLAHELGHLVMHRGLRTGSVETESAADKFASAFLLPKAAFAPEFRSSPFSWRLVFDLKRRWQVSAAAIVRRGRDLGLIDEVTYRRAFQYMSAKRWRTEGEPYEPTFQEPELFSDSIKALRSNGDADLIQLCERVGITLPIFSQVTGIKLHRLTPPRVLTFPEVSTTF